MPGLWISRHSILIVPIQRKGFVLEQQRYDFIRSNGYWLWQCKQEKQLNKTSFLWTSKTTGKAWPENKASLDCSRPGWNSVEFLLVACMVLCSGFVTETVLITHKCYSQNPKGWKRPLRSPSSWWGQPFGLPGLQWVKKNCLGMLSLLLLSDGCTPRAGQAALQGRATTTMAGCETNYSLTGAMGWTCLLQKFIHSQCGCKRI